MVKNLIYNTKLSFCFKNLQGIDTLLKIDKQRKSVIVTLEQKILSSLYRMIIDFTVAVLVLIVVQLVLNNIGITTFVTAIFIVVLFYKIISVVREESLIMVHSLGYQVTTKYILGQKDLFIPWNQVQNFFINEVIIRHKVILLLCLLTKEEDVQKLIPLFVNLQPRLQQLELIYQHMKGATS